MFAHLCFGSCAGSLGYISFNETFDLNIVIRTAVITPDNRISIGAGGAIVVQSGEVPTVATAAAAEPWHR